MYHVLFFVKANICITNCPSTCDKLLTKNKYPALDFKLIQFVNYQVQQ